MRTIKFRAWDTEGKYMKTGGISILNSDGTLETDGKSEVMQFTGLLDKNGKEIYEGDIVSHFKDPSGYIFPEPYLHKIEWNHSGFTFAGIKNGMPSSFIIDDKWTPLIEVIGNIYENRDILN